MPSFSKATAIKTTGGAGAVASFVICCMAFISPHEGIKYTAYADGGGVYTICRGHTANVHKGDTATQEQCDEWFQEDTVDALNTVNRLTENAYIPPETKKVFVDQVFNAGSGLFSHSTMLKKIKVRDLEGACREFPRWKYVNGKDCTIRSNNCYGIITRRATQMAECLKGLE